MDAFQRGFEKRAGKLGEMWKKLMTVNLSTPSSLQVAHTAKLEPELVAKIQEALKAKNIVLPAAALGGGLGLSHAVGKNVGDRLTKKEKERSVTPFPGGVVIRPDLVR